MAAPASQASSMEAFDAYFRRADLDKDGRVSGAEAVAFFQGSNLPKHVLAQRSEIVLSGSHERIAGICDHQIWNYADQKHTGYLGRQEFYNYLRLVTVAQSGRELTPDLVRAALFGPAAAKIPAPHINPPSIPTAQMNSLATPTPSTQIGVTSPTQNPGITGQQAPPNAAVNQQFFPAGNHFIRPPQATSAAASLPLQGGGQQPPGAGSMVGPPLPSSNTPNLSANWLGSRTSGASVGGISQGIIRGATPSANQDGFGTRQWGPPPAINPRPQTPSAPASAVPPKSPTSASLSFQPVAADSKTSVVSGNGFSSDSSFGGDIFSATALAKQDTSLTSSTINVSSSSSVGTAISGSQGSIKPGQVDSLQNKPSLPLGGNQLQRTQSPVNQNQLGAIQSTSALTIPDIPVGAVGPASSQSQPPWPKISQSDVQRYSGIFVQVDKDRDGKITGQEARNLFLSWKLPREVLKQVWDLSDQDNDSMLSLREFCTALYLMERYREGRSLPTVLPISLRSDEAFSLTTAQPSTAQPSTAYGGPVWQPRPGLSPQGVPESRPVVHITSVKQPVHALTPSQADVTAQPTEQKSRVPVLEKHLVDQLSNEEQSALNSKFQEATDADKKVQELEKVILDSKEKIEFYHAKMQELVLYKSRCDNRLNEITERASADKREFESLAKKYEQKCKQVGDVASKLTIEEATFRDIQERKLELYNAIVKMGQDGSADGVLQVRTDQIQSDLEQLVKSLNEQCKRFGLRAKPTSLVELPFGWQPGIQAGAADWDEDWDKLEEDGFTVIKELTVEVENVVAPAKPKPPTVHKDKTSKDEASAVVSSLNVDNKIEKPSTPPEQMAESELTYARSEDGSEKSSPGSPGRNAADNPSEENHLTQSGVHDISARARESNSDHGAAESSMSVDKFGDEPSWGPTFDHGDDGDSIWNFDSKESDNEKSRHNFFGSDDFGLYPIRTDSPGAASVSGKEKKNPLFDSAPSTPLFSSSFSPRFNEGPDDNSFDSFAHFDSFRMQETGVTQNQMFARFDSIRNTTNYHDSGVPQNQTYARFDSIRSTADYPQHQTYARFDSIRSTTDYGFTVIKELTVEVENVVAPAKPKPPTVHKDKTSKDEASAVVSSLNVDNKIEKPSTPPEQMAESELTYARSEDGSEKSSPGSPGRNAADNPSEENHLTQSGVHDISARARESNSDHGAAESSMSVDKFGDEPSWGPTFDHGDDGDSIWNFDSKESDNEKSRHNFFGSDDFGLYPIRTDSPGAASVSGKEKKNPLFDSAPSTPLFSSSFSPRFNEGPDDNSFDSFAHFDSFRMQETGVTQNQMFARFDSIRNTTNYHDSGVPQNQTYARFDSIRSTADYPQHQTYARFDSIRSTTDYGRGFSFDDADPFGSGPFKTSESHSPRTGTDNWSAF
ncbi:putative epidermal growth factor receptor substrate 15-like 1 [Cocos nucifera]|uniref:Putative epidermal growth factor receptor substrate 15-like 1 n=1 Tax=Cocos nucifera TaxID=13894 RepID=A0A8K0N723_COCNU|nr:putative epidermal growth factor receptor substrate 15-like 1 [Cocos nucifera]